MRQHDVRCLLMGGQACVFYGAAEFSRDTDLALLADPDNLARLRRALNALDAEVIALPPLDIEYLRRGHAVHFRCSHPDADGMRIDVMSVMRGVEAFPDLWSRRSTVEVDAGECYDLLGLSDLVRAKKTQRDKDWPMIRRLVEADYELRRQTPGRGDLRFWFLESRTPELLASLAAEFPAVLVELQPQRELLRLLPGAAPDVLERGLVAEALRERDADRAYWASLRRELEQLRHGRNGI